MAKNRGDGKGRVGAVMGRTQSMSRRTGLWTKRNTSTGRLLSTKKSSGPYKGVRRTR